MKNSLGSFSKLFLISLLAGSLMLAGCGESNPTSSTTTEDSSSSVSQDVTDNTASQYDVIGKVSPTIGQFDTNAKINIILTNIATKGTITNSCQNQMFAFMKVNAGYYEVKAVDSSNIYETEIIYKKVDSNIEDLSLTLTPKVQEVDDTITVTLTGKIIDEYGKDIPFASVTAVNTKTEKEITTSTNPDSGEYTFKDMPAGTYKVTFSKDSFRDETKDLKITDENTITFDSKTVNNNTLSNVTLTYKLAQTGAMAGVLTGYNPGDKCKLYRTSNENATTVPGVILKFTPQDNGYFFIKNLPTGWYIVAKDGCADPVAVFDQNNNLIGYAFANEDDTYFSSWLEVLTDTTTPVPSTDQ
ncbi:MAG: carboxypeptidase regulatory-like domain-containing protein [Candidatus Riflebacteria bacterium]|nr:carboxypeptidase regulatory-like domain-containing protein [Candidatus Riflebacteria bacterium]